MTTTVPNPLLDKNEVRIRRMFGQIAPWYDFLNHFLSLNIDRYWRRKLTKLTPPTPGKPVLDLCTGTGDLAFALDKAAKQQCPIEASDFCPEMLELARKKAIRNGADSRIKFTEADSQELPFAENTFDLVTVAFGLRNVTDTHRGIAEMVRVASPGGRIAILELSRPKGRLLGPLYRWYFRKVLPTLGHIFCRNPESAYRYLPESVMAFPDGDQLADMLRQHGLTEVRYHPMTFGVTTLYIGVKPV